MPNAQFACVSWTLTVGSCRHSPGDQLSHQTSSCTVLPRQYTVLTGFLQYKILSLGYMDGMLFQDSFSVIWCLRSLICTFLS